MNVLWVLLLCNGPLCVSIGVAFTSLQDCERELMPTTILSMECSPREGI